MRIAINTRLLISDKLDGIGWFTAETTRRIVERNPEHEFILLYDRKPKKDYIKGENVTAVVLPPQARHPILWYLFFEWSVRWALRRYKIDLFLSPDGWMSLKTKVPTLTVIHDLNFEHSSDYLKSSHQRYMKYYFPRFARKATRIATVSEFSKRDISECYGIDSKKIDVVYDGAHEYYIPIGEKEKEAVKEKYTGGRDYFIFVGTISKRKNLENILKAFELFKERNRTDTKLVVVGKKVWWDESIEETFERMSHKGSVQFEGQVGAEELSKLMASSLALVYSSLFEGFGIPIVEAFEAETAVITSNTTSMPEIAGEAAIQVNPHSKEEIAAAMTKIVCEPEERERLIALGRERKKLYSWDKTAMLLWESMMDTYDTRNE